MFTTYRSSTTQYLNDLVIDLSTSLQDKSSGAIKTPMYSFLLVLNSDIGPD